MTSALLTHTNLPIRRDWVKWLPSVEPDRATVLKIVLRNQSRTVIEVKLDNGKLFDFPPRDTIRREFTRKYSLGALGDVLTRCGLDEIYRYPKKPPEGAGFALLLARRDGSAEQGRIGVGAKVFISYSHEGERPGGPWMKTAKEFADLLNNNGVDADIDQYGNHLDRDWGLWGPQAIEAADVIVLLASPDYHTKWGTPSGSGVSDEARTIRARLRAKGPSALFVVLPGRSSKDIPLDMQTRNYVEVSRLDHAGIEEVLRLITNQPRSFKPKAGRMPRLPSD